MSQTIAVNAAAPVTRVLILAEHNNQRLSSVNLQVIAAALQLSKGLLALDLLIVGHGCESVASDAEQLPHIRQVVMVDAPAGANQLAENLAPIVASLAGDYRYVIAGATTWGKNLLPRAAALLDIQPLTDVVAIEAMDTEPLVFTRPIYAGSALERLSSNQSTDFISFRPSAFNALTLGAPVAINLTAVTAPEPLALSRFIEQSLSISARPELTAARVVVSGGRGLQTRAQFELVYTLADKLGAAVGASRAAVDAGIAGNELQVGQTGKIVAPELYIALGLSGAVQHLAGMSESRLIVAINSDPDAPIFQVADYGLVADVFTAVPELLALL
jgi:electron transfer flavoprotein alpha subunit